MDFMFDWEAEGDQFSFEDSDRFEEDSLCSWLSEPESLCNNWRGWRKQNGGQALPVPTSSSARGNSSDFQVPSLVELGSTAVACHFPFEVVEHFYPPIPENLQLRIAFWSFPENEEDIRLYSCLANGSAEEFQKGEHLFKARGVKDALQIGFHLSATVVPPQTLAQAKGSFNVAVVFDRRRITSCNCTCSSTASWCAHVVALCLYRIHQANSVCLRAPVSESLSRLHRDQLQKFAQYLISELPQQILPTAQRLLDELLSSQQTAINTVCGAPDPTAGPSASEQTTWCLDEQTLHENIKKTLIKFCVPSPIVFSDVNYLSSTAPPAAAEWQSLLRPLRGREPEGVWNLLSIVREMFRRNDSNATPLLEILTEEVLACEQILIWWFNTKVSASHNSSNSHSGRGNQNSSSSSQHAASSMCDEIVTLWRLAALNPALSPIQQDDLCQQLKDWHIKTIDKVRKTRNANMPGNNQTVKKADIELYSGFKAAIEACQLDWRDYPIEGVTYVERDRLPECRKMGRKGHGVSQTTGVPPRSELEAALHAHQSQLHHMHHMHLHPCHHSQSQENNTSDLDPGGACSSSSEGFCENDRLDGPSHDSDSDLSVDGMNGLPDRSLLQTEGASMAPSVARSAARTAAAVAAMQLPGILQTAKSEDLDSDGSLPGPSGYQVNGGSSSKSNSSQVVGGAATEAAANVVAALAKGDESQPSSDEYQLYFFNPKAKVNEPAPEKKKKSDEPNYFAGIRKLENKQEILFARAEGMHAHGHAKEACSLTKQLAEEMLANPPDLTIDTPPQNTGKSKKKKAQNNISSFASTTLAKAAFLCSVLLEDPECHHLAFQVGMFGLEMPRPPASSKALEVKLAHQESELAALLKRIPLGQPELNVIRDRAERLRDGKLKLRGEALLPLTLASFIFDSLVLPAGSLISPVSSSSSSNRNGSNRPAPPPGQQTVTRSPSDEKLGYEAAVAALGLKANVSEAEHPLLCEGTRRQRGDLAIAMLVHYKDDQNKLSKIMDKILDKDIHQLYKAPTLTTYLSSSVTGRDQHGKGGHHSITPHERGGGGSSAPNVGGTGNTTHHRHSGGHELEGDDGSGLHHQKAAASNCKPMVATTSAGDTLMSTVSGTAPSATWQEHTDSVREAVSSHSLDYLNLEQNFSQMTLAGGAGARPKTSLLHRYSSKDTDSSAVEEDGDTNADYKAWEIKFRCTNLKSGKNKQHSVGMAAVDSSAPETTSSDNSPTLVRRNWIGKQQGPGSDSGSSGKSSDSIGSSSSGDKAVAAKLRDNESPVSAYGGIRIAPHMVVDSRASTPNIKGARYKGKNRAMPTVPNQPSEASAHFMFELAKTVLTKAGGNSSTSLFTQPATNNTHNGPHRNLHLCAFQIGLYALGLHNCVSPNWLSRTYSSHVSWITGQAMEIGSAAINILIETWESHLTPPEVASLADRASRGRDPNMVRAAAELALSCLPHAHALNPNEIQRALIQCKEQSREMLERACLAVESAAKGGGVYPEVLFDVAKRWYELYEETMQGSIQSGTGGSRRNANIIHEAISQAVVPLQAQQTVMVEASQNQAVLQLVPMTAHSGAAGTVAVATVQAGPSGQPGQIPAGAVPLPPMPYTIPPAAPNHPQLPHHPYIAPYSYVQQIPPNFSHHYSQPHIPLHTHNMHPSYMASYPYQNQNAFQNIPHMGNVPHNAATLYHANVSHMRPPPPTAVQVSYNGQTAQLTTVQARTGAGVVQNKVNFIQAVDPGVVVAAGTQAVVVTTQGGTMVQAVAPSTPPQQPVPQDSVAAHQNTTQLNYLLSSYRVGMLAMETLARRVHDDRPQTKYARNPPYGEDVKWLLLIAMKLGTTYLQQFCAAAVNAVVSPFVLQDIAVEAANYLARSNPAQVTAQLRSPTLNSLVQKCLQMFIQCSHQRMHHITQAEYEEFITIVCSARNAFCMSPGGMVQFNELLQSLRRSKSCKKDLWQRIVNALATGNI